MIGLRGGQEFVDLRRNRRLRGQSRWIVSLIRMARHIILYWFILEIGTPSDVPETFAPIGAIPSLLPTI